MEGSRPVCGAHPLIVESSRVHALLKSLKIGFMDLIKASFLVLFQDLSCFSREIAVSASLNCS